MLFRRKPAPGDALPQLVCRKTDEEDVRAWLAALIARAIDEAGRASAVTEITYEPNDESIVVTVADMQRFRLSVDLVMEAAPGRPRTAPTDKPAARGPKK